MPRALAQRRRHYHPFAAARTLRSTAAALRASRRQRDARQRGSNSNGSISTRVSFIGRAVRSGARMRAHYALFLPAALYRALSLTRCAPLVVITTRGVKQQHRAAPSIEHSTAACSSSAVF